MSKYDKMYRHKVIPKKSGGKRHLYDPYAELRELHSEMLPLILKQPVHKAAMAFELGCDPVVNAMQHKRKYIAVCDFKEFFSSISMDVVKKNAPKLAAIPNFDSAFRCGGLPQGTEISPFITNRVMYVFDHIIAAYCKKIKVTYTRYADDITFSWNYERNDTLSYLMKKVNKELKDRFGGKLFLKKEKTHFYDLRKGNCAKVTGVNIFYKKGNYYTSAGRSFMDATNGIVEKLIKIVPTKKTRSVRQSGAFFPKDKYKDIFFLPTDYSKKMVKDNAAEIIKLAQILMGRIAWVKYIDNDMEKLRLLITRRKHHIKSWVLWCNLWIKTANYYS